MRRCILYIPSIEKCVLKHAFFLEFRPQRCQRSLNFSQVSQSNCNNKHNLALIWHPTRGRSFISQLCFLVSISEEKLMEVLELLEDKAGQSHGRVVWKWQPRNSCMTTQSSNKLFVLCTTTTVLCTTTVPLSWSTAQRLWPGVTGHRSTPADHNTSRVLQMALSTWGCYWRATSTIIGCICRVAGVEQRASITLSGNLEFQILNRNTRRHANISGNVCATDKKHNKKTTDE